MSPFFFLKEHAKVVGRRSPPASSVSATGASKQMLVRRSKSSAILPLRKHLIEKTIAEQQQKVVAAQAAAAAAAASAATTPSGSTAFSSSPDSDSSTGKSLSIRPIEEVMEEDSFSRSGSMTNIMGSNPAESNAMEVDSISEQPPQQVSKKCFFMFFSVHPYPFCPLRQNGPVMFCK